MPAACDRRPHPAPADRSRSDPAIYAQYPWDPRTIDAPVCRFRNADGSADDGLEEVLFYSNTQDANCNVTALVNTSGGVVERYTYDAYGKVTFRPHLNWPSGLVPATRDDPILGGGTASVKRVLTITRDCNKDGGKTKTKIEEK